MKASLLKGETQSMVKNIKESREAGDLFISKLQKVIKDKQNASVRASRNSDYDSPNWAYLQADARGYERAIDEVLSLLTK